MRISIAILALGLHLVSAGGAAAAPIVIEMAGEGAREGIPGIVDIAVTLTIDDAYPDGDPTSGMYLASNHGDVVVTSGSTLSTTASLIAADSSAGTWTLDFTVFEPTLSVFADTQIIFTGLGLTPDQIVPDFDSITSGVWTTSISGLPDVVGTIAIVPEPGTGLLVALGLAGLGARRRLR